MEVRIEKLEPMTLAFIRHVGPYDDGGVERTWEKLRAWAGARGLLGPRTWKVGISHDNPHVTPADKLRYDACVTVDPGFRPEGEVGVQTLPGGEYAVVTHEGQFERMHETYAFLYGEWLPKSGREAADSPGFTVHHNSPRDTPPEALVTDIYLPLRPR
jgi:AraC family transcriptional regulator